MTVRQMGYEIIRYRREFRDQVICLMGRHWGPDEAINDACFEWKYDRNPYFDEPLLYLALDGARVAGMSGLFGAAWRSGTSDRCWRLPCKADSYIEPGDRNQGLFYRLTKHLVHDMADLGYSHILNFSPSAQTAVNSMLSGWVKLGTKQRMSRFRSDNPAVQSDLSAAKNAARQFQTLDRSRDPGPAGSPGGITVAATPRPAAMAQLIDGLTDDGRLAHVRDETYFAWRFGNPYSKYRFLYCGDGDLDGYLVLQHQTARATNRVLIVDLAAISKDVEAKLLRAAVELGDFQHLCLWTSTLSEDRREFLMRLGFQPDEGDDPQLRFDSALLIYALGDPGTARRWQLGGTDLRRTANWNLHAIYSDAF